MRKVLLSIAILMFLAAGIGGWLLYSLSERAFEGIEESIIEFDELEQQAAENSQEEKPSPNEPKAMPGATKPKARDSSSVTDVPLPVPPQSTGSDTPIKNSEDNSFEKAEIAKDVKSKVPISEKASLTKLVLSKLTKSDISELKGMLSNGITAEEKKRAKAILYSRLSAEEINRIKEAYVKYVQEQ